MCKMPVVRGVPHGDVLIITIDQPPINFCPVAVRRSLRAAIERLGGDAALRAAIFVGVGNDTVCWSDLRDLAGGTQRLARLVGVAPAIELVCRATKLPATQALAAGLLDDVVDGDLVLSAIAFVRRKAPLAKRRIRDLTVVAADQEGLDAVISVALNPFAVADLSGLDIAWQMRRATGEDRMVSTRYARFSDRLREIGRLGRKSGGGYYDYDDKGRRSSSTGKEVRQIIDADSLEHGLLRRHLSAEEIQRRALLSMVNEACHVLRDGVVPRPSDVDVVLVNGYGFPRWLGGAVHWANRLGPEHLRRELVWLAEISGASLPLGDVDALFA